MKRQELSNTELSLLCQELSLLLHAGVAPGDGLFLLAEEEQDPGLRRLLTDMARALEEGRPLAVALAASGVFPLYVTGLVEVGERTGRTEEALAALSRYYEERERMDRRIRSALTYPAILLLLMLVVIVVLLSRVLPVFDEVYASLGGRLTGLAGGLLLLGRALDAAMPILCAVLALAAGFVAAFSLSCPFRSKALALWRRRSGDQGVSRKMNDARFAQALSMGLDSGLPLEEAAALAAGLLADVPSAAARCRDCHERLSAGADLAQAMRETGMLPAASCHLLALGLRSGSGDAVMGEIARRLSEEADQALESRVSKVEPALVLVTSILVGAILLSVMLPLMNIMTAIG